MVAEKGVTKLSLRGVARRVGVTHSAPYRHFEDKRELTAAMAEAGFNELREAMLDALEAASDKPEERLFAVGRAYVEFAVDNPAHFQVMFGPNARDGDYPSLTQAHQSAYKVLLDTVTECQKAGVVRAGNPATRAMAAWTVVHGLASLFVNGVLDTDDPDHVQETIGKICAQVFNGLVGPNFTP